MIKRRFNSSDFNNNKEDVIVNLNDFKKVFKEYVLVKMEKDFEDMVRKYFKDKIGKK